MIPRLSMLLIATTVLSISPLIANETANEIPTRPNIILVMPDDTGYGDYACLGNPISRTPVVDAFKKESMLFTRFHVSPTCSPCRAALLSGRHEFRCGVTHTIGGRERMSLDTYSLPQMLASVGYTSGIFGKWHLGDEEAYRPESRGFDEVYIHGSGGIGQSGDAPGNTNIDPTLWHNGTFVKTQGYCTDLFFEQATRWMDEKQQSKQPFFAYISLNAAHAPHVLPEKDYQQYLGHPRLKEEQAKYYGMVENIDTNFGVLLKKLEQWDIADNTLVIYLGTDNGGTAGRNIFNAGMKGGKATPYQGGTRAPCFVRWPAGGVPASVECDELTAHFDLYPTLAEITGATLTPALKTQLEGRSLLPLLSTTSADWTDRTLVHHVGRWPKGESAAFKFTKCAIQNSQFTLVNNEELYDLKADPGENTNVITKHPEVVAKLRADYDRWWDDTLPLMVHESVTQFDNFTFRKLYEKQFGKSATAEAVQRGKNNRVKRKSKPSANGDQNDRAQRIQKRKERAERKAKAEAMSKAKGSGSGDPDPENEPTMEGK